MSDIDPMDDRLRDRLRALEAPAPDDELAAAGFRRDLRRAWEADVAQRRRRWQVSGAVTAIIAVAAALFFYWSSSRPSPDAAPPVLAVLVDAGQATPDAPTVDEAEEPEALEASMDIDPLLDIEDMSEEELELLLAEFSGA